MPLYVIPVPIQPNTADHSPIQLQTSLIAGLITNIEIEFYDGCLGAVGIRISDGGKQFAPLPSGWITGNNRIIRWYEGRRLEGPPWVLTIDGYNDAIDYPHTPVIRLEVV